MAHGTISSQSARRTHRVAAAFARKINGSRPRKASAHPRAVALATGTSDNALVQTRRTALVVAAVFGISPLGARQLSTEAQVQSPREATATYHAVGAVSPTSRRGTTTRSSKIHPAVS
jgi:hypothetical protein